ncbi:MAG: hypothetical protein ABIK62_05635 [candidate division WOR-3 bacterium]
MTCLPVLARRLPLAHGFFLGRLLRESSGATTLEYVVAALAVAFAAVAASQAITGVLGDYLHRIYLVVTLPVP